MRMKIEIDDELVLMFGVGVLLVWASLNKETRLKILKAMKKRKELK